MQTTSGLSLGLTMMLPVCKSVGHSTGNDISSGSRTYGMTASNWSRRRIWKSGEVSSVERVMTSSTNREGVNSLSHFSWILMIARTNAEASGPEYNFEYNEWNRGRRSEKNEHTRTPISFHIGSCTSPNIPINQHKGRS